MYWRFDIEQRLRLDDAQKEDIHITRKRGKSAVAGWKYLRIRTGNDGPLDDTSLTAKAHFCRVPKAATAGLS